MVLLKPFLAIAILALSQLASATPAKQCQKESCQKKKSQKGPLPRIHTISSKELATYQGTLVPHARPLEPRFLVGEDSRKKWDSKDKEYPFTAIRVVKMGKEMCTGTAVGPRHVMTAQHCFPDKLATVKMEFDGKKGTFSNVVDVIVPTAEQKSCRGSDDFAILVFDKPLFEKSGYFGAKHLNCRKDRNKPIFKHAGYPLIDKKLKRLRQDDITVKMCNVCDRGTQLATDADVDSGQSGGPLYRMEDGAAWQYGVLSGYDKKIGSIFSSGPNFVNAIALARDRYP